MNNAREKKTQELFEINCLLLIDLFLHPCHVYMGSLPHERIQTHHPLFTLVSFFSLPRLICVCLSAVFYLNDPWADINLHSKDSWGICLLSAKSMSPLYNISLDEWSIIKLLMGRKLLFQSGENRWLFDNDAAKFELLWRSQITQLSW